MSEEKQYYAFISYKREDKRDAKRLQHQLEYYRLPNQLRRDNPDLPEYVRPVFRDMTDLEVGELSTLIHEALEQSHYLIVVCSPRAAKSKWVNDEVEYFISLGKQDKIIPYIIEGVPHADDPLEECYPPALLQLSKEKELLGANINEVGKEAAGIRVVAKMFGIRYDMLYQRYKREQRRKYTVILSFVIAFILLLLSFSGYVIYSNNELQDKNNKLKEYNDKIENQNKRLLSDSIIMAAQMDSIIIRDSLIFIQQDSIAATNEELTTTNQKIRMERDNVKRENWKMMEQQSRAVANRAEKCIENGDTYTAALLALSVLPQNISSPNRPWTLEAEKVLRKSLMYPGNKLHGHYFIKSVAYSPSGATIASASYKHSICLWDAKTGDCIRTLQGHTSSVESVAFSPDGKFLASASLDSTVRLWDVETGQNFCTLRGHSDEVNSILFSIDGKYLVSASSDSTLRLWDVASGKCTKILRGHKQKVMSVALCPNGKIIASGSWDGTVRLWDVETGQNFCTLRGHKHWIHSVAFNYDGQLIASSSNDATIRIWDWVNDSLTAELRANDGAISYHITFSPIENVLFATKGNDVCIWDVSKKSCVRTLSGHDESTSSLAVSPDGNHLVSGSMWDTAIRIWDIRGSEDVQNINETDYVTSVATNFDAQRTACAQFNKIIRLWNTDSGDSIRTLSGHSNWVTSVSFSPDGKILASGSWDNTIRLWETNTGDSIRTLRGHTSLVNFVAFSPDGKIVASSSVDATIRLWDVETGQNFCTLRGAGRGYNTDLITFSHGGRFMATTSNGNSVRLWDAKKGVCIQIILHIGSVSSIAFSLNDKQIVMTTHDETVRVWEFVSPDSIKQICKYEGRGRKLAFSPNGKIMVSFQSNDRKIHVWNAGTWEEKFSLFSTTGFVSAVAFSPDSRRFASVSNSKLHGAITIWDLTTNEITGTIEAKNIKYITFSPDNQYLIAIKYDGSMKKWYYPPIQTIIDEGNKKYKNHKLSSKGRREYYLE